MTTLAFCNSGRPDPARARHVLIENWQRNAEHVPERALWVAVEVDEGDVVNEHAIARSAIGGREIVGEQFREILIYNPRVWELLDEQHIPAAKGVPHQGPNRHVHVDAFRNRKSRREFTIIYGHFPTHAYNSHRDARMVEQYDHMFDVMKQAVAREQCSRDVFVLIDANQQHFPKLFPTQVDISVHAPDYILGYPLEGHTVDVASAWSEPMTIERAHKLQLATVTVRQETKR